MKIINGIVAFLVLFVIASCEDDSNSTPVHSHRIAQIYHDDSNSGSLDRKEVCIYEGEQLMLVSVFMELDNGEFAEAMREKMDYTDNVNSRTISFKLGDNWEPVLKTERVYQNDLLVEEIAYFFSDDVWNLLSKWTYQYSGSNLVRYQSFEYENGVPKATSKSEYVYEADKLMECKEFSLNEVGDWIQDKKEIMFYKGETLAYKILSTLDDSKGWTNSQRADYVYSAGRLVKCDNSTWDSTRLLWIVKVVSYFQYDEDGCLVKTIDGDGTSEIYTYEEGKGNYADMNGYPEDFIKQIPEIQSTTDPSSMVPYVQGLINKVLR